jgi:hypothetical protein
LFYTTEAPSSEGASFSIKAYYLLTHHRGVIMGKKRRLISSRAKFGLKHANHPRMVLLKSREETTEVIEEAPAPVEETKVAAAAEEVQPIVEEKAVTKPKTTRKKKTTTLRSRTKKKVTQDTTA